MKNLNLLLCIFIFIFFLIGCSEQTNFNMIDAIGKAEDEIKQLEKVKTTASTFDGENRVKFRLMVNEQLSKEEATVLFKQVLDKIEKHSNPEVWLFFEGSFDIKSYENGVIYEATKLIGDELVVTSK